MVFNLSHAVGNKQRIYCFNPLFSTFSTVNFLSSLTCRPSQLASKRYKLSCLALERWEHLSWTWMFKFLRLKFTINLHVYKSWCYDEIFAINFHISLNPFSKKYLFRVAYLSISDPNILNYQCTTKQYSAMNELNKSSIFPRIQSTLAHLSKGRSWVVRSWLGLFWPGERE